MLYNKLYTNELEMKMMKFDQIVQLMKNTGEMIEVTVDDFDPKFKNYSIAGINIPKSLVAEVTAAHACTIIPQGSGFSYIKMIDSKIYDGVEE